MLRVLLVVALVAGLIYLSFWMLERRRAAGEAQQHPSRRPGRKQPPPRFVAPDDDDEFLRDLDRKRRQGDNPG